jgi:hypothetical protein
LPRALVVAMHWQGLARNQDNPENAYLCHWIALERLGEGSHHLEAVSPAVSALFWHPGWYDGEDAEKSARLYNAERTRLGKLLHALKKIRNNDVVHRGRFRHIRDERYAQWILRYWVNDLTHLYWDWIESEQIRTFEDLRHTFGLSI